MRALQALARLASQVVAVVLLLSIHAYRMLLSPLLGGCCRFEPSCSAYAVEAVTRHGPVRGAWLAVRRVLRCHPLRPGGYDPVPREAPGGP
jgi:putative membrane protein insertion efficiency factor